MKSAEAADVILNLDSSVIGDRQRGLAALKGIAAELHTLDGRVMRVYDLMDKAGRVFAFEVNNAMLGRGGVARVVERIAGATITKRYRLFRWDGDDEFCHFEVDGALFVVWEPWGDSNQYWIGPADARVWVPQIEKVRDAFLRARAAFGFVW